MAESYYQRNREAILAYQRTYHTEHYDPARQREQRKRRQLADPEKWKEQRRIQRERHYALRNEPHD